MDAATFYTTFQSLKNEVQTALDNSPPTAQAELATLRRVLAEHRASLPAYDQRSCDSQLRDLETQLASRRADKPKSKFAFKRSTTSTSTSTPTPTPPPPPPQAPISTNPSSTRPPTTHTLSDRKDAHLTTTDYAPSSAYTLTLSNLTNCTIDLRDTSDATLTSLHAHNLHNCIVYASIDGSVLLTAITGSVLVLTTRQFRLHDSHDVVVLLEVGSLPVIERCEKVLFGPYGDGSGKYAQVQDFDWVRGGPSPHWRVMDSEEVSRVREGLGSGSASEIVESVA